MLCIAIFSNFVMQSILTCEKQTNHVRANHNRNLDSFLQRMLHIHDIYRLKNLNYKEDIEAAVKK